MKTGIYTITNKRSGKKYVGQAKDIFRRWQQHEDKLSCDKHENKDLQADFNKLGTSCFEYAIVEECKEQHLTAMEKYYMEYYYALEKGYNNMPIHNVIKKDNTNVSGNRNRENEKRNVISTIEHDISVNIANEINKNIKIWG